MCRTSSPCVVVGFAVAGLVNVNDNYLKALAVEGLVSVNDNGLKALADPKT